MVTIDGGIKGILRRDGNMFGERVGDCNRVAIEWVAEDHFQDSAVGKQ